MALKFQLQFAGADFSRPSSPYRKALRIFLISAAVILSGLAYWGYLHHLTHRSHPVARQVAPAAPAAAKVATPNAVKQEAPTPTLVPAAEPAPTLKKIADASLVAVGNYLIRAGKVAPATPEVTTMVPTQPVAVPTPAPTPVAVVVSPSSVKTAARPYRVHTDQERLQMAGQTAFDNVMDAANKYPDAYGFAVSDSISEAKLGAPMQVYTISESDRINYQTGQPIKPLLKPAKQWVFPIMMGDRICCMVEVSQRGHDYIPGKGNKSLAMAWNKINEKWSSEDGYHPMLVVNPDVPGYYFTVPELPEQNITDTIEMFYLHPGYSPADVILASWR